MLIRCAACAGSAPASAAYPTPAYMAAGPGAGVSEVAQPSSNPYDHYIGVQVCFHEIYGSHVLAALTSVRILCRRFLFTPFLLLTNWDSVQFAGSHTNAWTCSQTDGISDAWRRRRSHLLSCR